MIPPMTKRCKLISRTFEDEQQEKYTKLKEFVEVQERQYTQLLTELKYKSTAGGVTWTFICFFVWLFKVHFIGTAFVGCGTYLVAPLRFDEAWGVAWVHIFGWKVEAMAMFHSVGEQAKSFVLGDIPAQVSQLGSQGTSLVTSLHFEAVKSNKFQD